MESSTSSGRKRSASFGDSPQFSKRRLAVAPSDGDFESLVSFFDASTGIWYAWLSRWLKTQEKMPQISTKDSEEVDTYILYYVKSMFAFNARRKFAQIV